jgi:hypothetical protein
LPAVWDGRNVVTREWGFDANSAGIWLFTPWLPLYVTASFFSLLGANPFVARLPSVLAGLVAIFALYGIVLRQTESRRLALLSAALLTLNVQFLLLVRQGQWYALAILWTVMAAGCYTELVAGRGGRFASVGLAVSLALLFYTDYFVCPLVVSGFVVHYLCSGGYRSGTLTRRLLTGTLLSLAMIAPWLIYIVANRAVPMSWHPSNHGYRVANPLGGVWEAGQYILSPLVLCGVVARYLFERRSRQRRSPLGSLPLSFIAGVSLAFLGFVSLGLPAIYGYFAPAIPAFCVLLASLLTTWWSVHRGGAIVIALALVATNLGEIWLPWFCNLTPKNRHFAPAYWRSDLGAYLRELACGIHGPMDRLVEYVSSHGAPDDGIFVNYEAQPLLFHTKLRLLREIPFSQAPRFIVRRALRGEYGAAYESVLMRSPVFAPDHSQYVVSWQRQDSVNVTTVHQQYLTSYLRRLGYVPVALPPCDTFRQNHPEIRKRFTELSGEGKEVELWRLPEQTASIGSQRQIPRRVAATPRGS